MILDLGMHNLIDPWSGEENYDDITMSALRYLAKKRESSEGGNIGFAHPVRFGGGVTGDRQRNNEAESEPEENTPSEEFHDSIGEPQTMGRMPTLDFSHLEPETPDDALGYSNHEDGDEDNRPLPRFQQVALSESNWPHAECRCRESIEEAARTGEAIGDIRFGHITDQAYGCGIYDQAVMYREEEIRAEEQAYDEGPPEGQPGASLPTAQEINNGQMDNGDRLPW